MMYILIKQEHWSLIVEDKKSPRYEGLMLYDFFECLLSPTIKIVNILFYFLISVND